ncbi:MAG TPA: GNAT family N-acetyltransferase [Acidimicrobiales bacterium]|nr:GNAT family N-acetyltransferase [Acidimicrobiales bacterium]
MEVVESRLRPDLEEQAEASFRARWPEFIFHDAVSNAHIGQVGEHFGTFDLWVVDDGRVVAGGWGVPLAWDGTLDDLPEGYDGALVRSLAGREAGPPADTLCIMAAAVASDASRKGLAGSVLTALRDKAREAGLSRVICPVRPTLKASYPLVPMARFARWRRDDGTAVDPWVRTHERLGAEILGPARRSMVITGSVADWEAWTGMVFPESDRYVVPDALSPVEIDTDADLGTYVEENLWMRHA